MTETLGGKFAQKEVIAKAKEVLASASLAKAGRDNYKPESEKLKKSNKAGDVIVEEEKGKKVEEEKKTEAPAAEWSDEQQKQLEGGMRKYGKDMDAKERWTKIAAEVEGKTPKECFERFKEICARLKKKKDAAK